LRVAPTLAACEESSAAITLVATGKLPELVRDSVWFASDEGRVDARGANLAGSSIVWKSEATYGIDTCFAPEAAPNGGEVCSWSIPRGFSVAPEDTQFYLLPAGAHVLDGAIFYDLAGLKVAVESLALHPARTTLLRVVTPDASVDLSTGQGEVPLLHPEAVQSADCGALSCEMLNGKLVLRAGAKAVSSIELKLRLVPDVFVSRKDNLESTVTVKLPIVHCPMSIVSGPPFRDNEDAKAIVRLTGRCGSDIGAFNFLSADRPLKVIDLLRGEDASFAVLRLGYVRDDAVIINAVRGDVDGVVIASAHAPTRATPQARSVLELAERSNLNFIPNNRPARVHVSAAGERLRFQVLPVDGVYDVIEAAMGPMVQADPNAAGLTTLRFGVRVTNLTDRLNKVDLAVVVDPLQRGTGQANMPVPIEPIEGRAQPLVEVWCGGGQEPLHVLPMGETAHLPYGLRDTCRVIFHREHLRPEYGTQKLNFEVDILRVDGTAKPEGKVKEVVTLRAGETPRYAWITGVANPFERVSVRVSHLADENHYLGAEDVRTGAASAQWSAVMGTGRVRIYGTTTIPTGLYRFGTEGGSGVMALNFGVISRLTWLDKEGREGLLGVETGVLVFGLPNSSSETGQRLTQVGAVLGLGMAVPIANRSQPTQASINLHAWFEINLAGNIDDIGRYAFIFGPSISIGSVGVNL
jgi:hypothetical protein